MFARARWLLFARRMRRSARKQMGPKLLAAFARAYPDAFFIEIGANDGSRGDHVASLVASSADWRGIMVEPDEDAFARLSANYGELERVVLERAAISDHDGRQAFYRVEPGEEGAPRELFGPYDQLSSLSRETLLSHRWITDVERRVVATEVDCMRLDSLCRRHEVSRIDLLVIDTEGYDYELLKQLEQSPHRPRLIVYEHALLRADDRARARDLLKRLGYELMEELLDTWAFDASPADELTRSWRELGPGVKPIVLREG